MTDEQARGTRVNQYLQKLTLTDVVVDQGQASKPLELALQVLHEGDFQQRWEVTKLFPRLGKQAIAPLLAILEDEAVDWEIRWFVGRILGQFDEAEVVISLVNLLQNTEEEDQELSMVAASALGNIGIAAIEALNQLLGDSSSRLLAVRTLAQIRHSEAVLSLMKVVDDPLPEVRVIALEALGSFHDRSLVTLFLKALHDPVVTVRKEAVMALGMQTEFKNEFNVVKQLKPLLYDPNLEVSQQTALALGRMGGNEAAEALFGVLKSLAPTGWLKQEVVGALGWIGTSQSLAYLQEGLSWEDREICQAIISVLGHQEKYGLRSQATQILIEFLNSEPAIATEPQIKQAVALSLGELGDVVAVNSLLKLAADPERGVQLHAIAALKKFPQVNIN